jgi:hypothetical protein
MTEPTSSSLVMLAQREAIPHYSNSIKRKLSRMMSLSQAFGIIAIVVSVLLTVKLRIGVSRDFAVKAIIESRKESLVQTVLCKGNIIKGLV